jgi:hypothetical protein
MASAQFRMSPIRPNGSLDSFKGDYNDENSSLLNGKGQDVEAAEKLLSSGTEDKSKPAKTSLLAGALYCCASMSMVRCLVKNNNSGNLNAATPTERLSLSLTLSVQTHFTINPHLPLPTHRFY